MTQGVRVLLVEDDELFRFGLTMALQKGGFNVVGEAVDGESALQMAADLSPELVLLDIGLPDLDGPDICQCLRRSYPRLPILVLTSHLDDHLAVQLLRAGVNGYCLKGLEAETLLLAMRSLLAGGAWWSDAAMEKLRQHANASSTGPCAWAEPPNEPVLTEREQEVLAWLAQGHSNQEIATALFISAGTVRVHVHSILQKLSVSNRKQAVLVAVQRGLLKGS